MLISLALNVRGLDDWQPFFDLRLLKSSERFGSLLLAREDLEAKVGESFYRRLIPECIYDRCIEHTDDRFRCASRHPDPKPIGEIDPGYPRLVHSRDI